LAGLAQFNTIYW